VRTAPLQSSAPQRNLTLEGTQDKVYTALKVIIIKTEDGVEHVLHFTKDLLVRGGTSSGGDALQGLETRSALVVHYTMKGGEARALEVDLIDDQGAQDDRRGYYSRRSGPRGD
jgi:hypothetical protein